MNFGSVKNLSVYLSSNNIVPQSHVLYAQGIICFSRNFKMFALFICYVNIPVILSVIYELNRDNGAL